MPVTTVFPQGPLQRVSSALQPVEHIFQALSLVFHSPVFQNILWGQVAPLLLILQLHVWRKARAGGGGGGDNQRQPNVASAQQKNSSFFIFCIWQGTGEGTLRLSFYLEFPKLPDRMKTLQRFCRNLNLWFPLVSFSKLSLLSHCTFLLNANIPVPWKQQIWRDFNGNLIISLINEVPWILKSWLVLQCHLRKHKDLAHSIIF